MSDLVSGDAAPRRLWVVRTALAQPGSSASASTAAHRPTGPRCACQEQSMNAAVWIVAVAVVVLVLHWLAGRRRAARGKGGSR